MKAAAQNLLIQCGISPQDRELIRLYGLHGNAAIADVRSWFSSIEFEHISSECACMAAVMCAESGYEGVPEALRPRLKGLLRYHRMLNSGLLASMCSLIRDYNRLDIDVLVMKGAAIKIGYHSNYVRPMWDVDILVREADFQPAVQFAQSLGYRGKWAHHSIDLTRGSTECIDLHRVYLRDLSSRTSHNYWPECRKMFWNGATFFVPEENALLVQLLVNTYNNFAQCSGIRAPLKWVMDLDALLQGAKNIDWDKAVRLARELEVAPQVSVVLAAYDCVLPQRVDIDRLLLQLNARSQGKRLAKFVSRYHRINSLFRHPPQDCSALRLAWIHIRWLWLNCQVVNPGSTLHALRTFPGYLRGELRMNSLLELPAVAVRKLKKHHKARNEEL